MMLSILALTSIAFLDPKHHAQLSYGKARAEVVKLAKQFKDSEPWRPSEQKIIGGVPVADDEATGVVGLVFCLAEPEFVVNGERTNCFNFCSGALIAPNVVLTAAHCLWDQFLGQPLLPTQLVYIRTSNQAVTRNLTDETFLTEYFPVRDAYVPELYQTYQSTYDNDVGVIVLENCVPGSPELFKVNTFDSGLGVAGTQSTIYGYGLNSGSAFAPDSELQRTSTQSTLGNAEECRDGLIYSFQLLAAYSGATGDDIPTVDDIQSIVSYSFDRTLCTGSLSGPYVSVCPGDSGGPQVQSGVIVGVTSFASSVCSAGVVSFAARVAYYADFVEDILENHANLTECGQNLADVFATYPLPAVPPPSAEDAALYACNVDDDTYTCSSESGVACLETSTFCDGTTDCSNAFDEFAVCPPEEVLAACQQVFADNSETFNSCADAVLNVLLSNPSTFEFRCQVYALCVAGFSELVNPAFTLACLQFIPFDLDNGLTTTELLQVDQVCSAEFVNNAAAAENWPAQIQQCIADDVAVCPDERNANFLNGFNGVCVCERTVEVTYTSEDEIDSDLIALALANALYTLGDGTDVGAVSAGTQHSVHTAHSPHAMNTPHVQTPHENSPHEDMMGGMAMGMGTVHESMSATEPTKPTVHDATGMMGMSKGQETKTVAFRLSYVNECGVTDLPSLNSLELPGATEVSVRVLAATCVSADKKSSK